MMEVCGLPRPELRERLVQGYQEWFSNRSFSIDKKEKERKERKSERKKEGNPREKERKEGRKEDKRSFSRCGKSAFQFCLRCECTRRVMMLTSLQLVLAKKLRDFGAGQG